MSRGYFNNNLSILTDSILFHIDYDCTYNCTILLCVKMRILKIFLIIIIIILSNCDKYSSTEPKNSLPVINRIVLEPENPQIMQVVKITSFASDADKHTLYYRWSVSEGALSNNGIGNPIYWSTPYTAGNVNIVCRVYDGIDIVNKSIGVYVLDDSVTSEPID